MIADHLSRLEKITEEEKGSELVEKFPYEQLFVLAIQTPWYVDIVNYLACRIMPYDFSNQQKRKLRTDSKFYIWDNPLLFRRGTDIIIWRCVLETKQGEIIDKCHASPYGGHFVGNKTTHKILQLGFYWPTLFKECFEQVKHWDKC